MGKAFQIDRSILLTTLTIVGMLLIIFALWPLQGAQDAAARGLKQRL